MSHQKTIRRLSSPQSSSSPTRTSPPAARRRPLARPRIPSADSDDGASEGSEGLENIKFTQDSPSPPVAGTTRRSGRRARFINSTSESEDDLLALSSALGKGRKGKGKGSSVHAPIEIDKDDQDFDPEPPARSIRNITKRVPITDETDEEEEVDSVLTPNRSARQRQPPASNDGKASIPARLPTEKAGDKRPTRSTETSAPPPPSPRHLSSSKLRRTVYVEVPTLSDSERAQYTIITDTSPEVLRQITERARSAASRSTAPPLPIVATKPATVKKPAPPSEPATASKSVTTSRPAPTSKPHSASKADTARLLEQIIEIADEDSDDSDELVLRRPLPKATEPAVAGSGKGKGRAVDPDDSTEEVTRPKQTSKSGSRRRPDRTGLDSNGHVVKKRKTIPKSPAKKTRPIKDPDEEDGGAVTEEEDNVLENLKMDQMSRFKTKTRLRRKGETAFQRNIRKLNERRQGVVHETTSDEDSDSQDDEEGQDEEDDSSTADSEDFIESDDGSVPEDLLPQQFSNNANQTPEFKFKVVFQYIVMLVIRGPDVLPLKGREQRYFRPPLEYLRRQTKGYREGRVRSQIWRANLVKSLNKHPTFVVDRMDHPEPGCDACNNSTKAAYFRVRLTDWPYDPETHEPLSSDDDSDEDSEEEPTSKRKKQEMARRELDSDEEEEGGRTFMMGEMCLKKSRCYHEMYHWEDALYRWVQHQYHDLLRALGKPVKDDSESSDSDEADASKAVRRQNRLARLKRHGVGLPKRIDDVNIITQWMVDMGYETMQFRKWDNLIRTSEALEKDKKTDANM